MIAALHGFTGGPELWQGMPCLAPTLLGHGPEARARGDESFESEVERLAARLPEDTRHLVGYSMGARLGLALALRHPARFQRLTLIGASPGLSSARERQERVEADQRWIDLLRERGIESFVEAWEALPMWRSQSRLPAARREAQRRARLAHDPLQLAFALESLGTGKMPSLWDALSELRIPVTLVVGCQDDKFMRIANAMQERLPRARTVVVVDTGHNPVLEKPEAIHALLSSEDPP